jgi:hypothetical protein
LGERLTRVGGDARMPDATFSGGGGPVASTADYLRFAQMLLNEGEYGNVRLLAPHTVRLWPQMHCRLMSAMPITHGGWAMLAPPRRWVRGLTSALRFVPRRGSTCPPLDARFRDQCLNEQVFPGCQWYGGSLKHGGAITMSAAPHQLRRTILEK